MTTKETPNVDNANEKWDEILNSPEGLDLLDSMADDALIDFESGKFTPMNQNTNED